MPAVPDQGISGPEHPLRSETVPVLTQAESDSDLPSLRLTGRLPGAHRSVKFKLAVAGSVQCRPSLAGCNLSPGPAGQAPALAGQLAQSRRVPDSICQCQ